MQKLELKQKKTSKAWKHLEQGREREKEIT